MSNEVIIVIISAVVPLTTLLYTIVGLRHKAEVDYVGRLEIRLEKAEDELLQCEKDKRSMGERLRKLEHRLDKK